jgi:Concanavalin A-like lectin/glucanases superfamily/Immunoglobulin I-set domain
MKKIIAIVVFSASVGSPFLQAIFAQGCAPAPSGMVAWWPAEGNANDIMGINNGTAYGGLTYAPGEVGTAFNFDGSSGYVSVPSSPSLLFSNAFTAEAWINLGTPPSGDETIAAKGVDANVPVDWQMLVYGGKLAVQINVAGNWSPIVCATTLSPGVWYHVAMTYDGSNLQGYVNGVLDGSVSVPGSMQTSSYALKIGVYSPAAHLAYFRGKIDELSLYSRTLSSNEIAAIYNAGSSGKCGPLRITQDLTNNGVLYGQNTTLGVQVSGSSPVTYQWYWVPANNSGQAGAYAQPFGSFIIGAVVTNGGFGYGNIPNVSFVGGGGGGAAGYGSVSNGVVTSITVTNPGSGYTSLPMVVIDPPNGMLLGQTNSTFTITNATQNSLGMYYVVISNTYGSVTSSVVNLSVFYPPSITINPVGFTGTYHSSHSLEVYVSGTPPFTYQWALNDTNINGATSNSYSINNLTITNTGAYTVAVSNPYGTTNSAAAYVYMAPALTSPFAGTTTLWGQDTTLDVGAIGSGVLNYQWYFNGMPINGANGSNYLLSSIQFTNAGLYNVVVSSAYGSVTNQAYQVVVNPANVNIALYPGIGISGTIGYSYVIQSTTDLSNTNAWVNETNIILSAPYQIWSDYSGMGAYKFYRVIAGQ